MKQKLICVILSILVVLTCAGCGGGSKPQATIRKYVTAYNRNDKDAMMECYEPAVQEIYDKAAKAGEVISAIPGWGALIGAIGAAAEQEAEEKRPKLSVKFKGTERVDEETVILTVEYTYTYRKKSGKKVKTEKQSEEQDVKMKLIDGTWYIAAPVDLQTITDSFSQIGSELAPIVSGAGGLLDGAMSAVGSAFNDYMQGQQGTTTTAAMNQQFSFSSALPDSALAKEIYLQLKAGTYKVSLSGERDFDDIRAAIEEIRAKYPEMFWINGSYNMQSDQTATTITFAQFQGAGIATLQQQSAELLREASAILNQLPENLSEYEQALWVHDYLVNNCVYDVKNMYQQDSDYCHTAYGCIVEHLAVCEGYARAYQYLMQALGFDCGRVSGTAESGHAWNYLMVNGDYYWVDVTWDDPTASDGSDADPGKLLHSYFLVDDAHIFRSRTLDDDNYFVPECTTMQMNYYVQNGRYFTEYDRGTALRAISEQHAQGGTIELMFAEQDAYAYAVSDLIDGNQIRTLPEFETAYYSYSADDKMYLLSIMT